jgi:Predicted ornithine cyclodeaminase, mu-crystallin homolog
LRAIANASAITAIRTAAVSGLATRALAKPDASTLAIIGAGVQARAHLEAIACVRKLQRVLVAARHKDSAERFARSMKSHVDCEIEPVGSPEEAVREADIIVTATTSREPVVQREWLSPGAHINAIGTFSPKARELDTATMASSSIFVDRRESAFNEAGDYLIAAGEGAIGPESILAELGEVLIGEHPGRRSTEESQFQISRPGDGGFGSRRVLLSKSCGATPGNDGFDLSCRSCFPVITDCGMGSYCRFSSWDRDGLCRYQDSNRCAARRSRRNNQRD